MFAAAVLVSACQGHASRSRAGDVLLDAVEPPDAPKFTLAPDQRFIVGQPIAATLQLPAYPAHLLAQQLPAVAICMEIETDVDGRVVAARRLSIPGRCDVDASAAGAALDTATREAVMQWRFEPTWLCMGLASGGAPVGTDCGDATAESRPLLRAYRFVFTQRDGAGSVRLGEQPPPTR